MTPFEWVFENLSERIILYVLAKPGGVAPESERIILYVLAEPGAKPRSYKGLSVVGKVLIYSSKSVSTSSNEVSNEGSDRDVVVCS